MRERIIERYDLSKFSSAQEMKDAVLCDSRLSDMEKLSLVFSVSKESLKSRDASLYYAILAVLDKAKSPMIFPFCDMEKLLGVKMMQRFSCGPYYYRLNDTPDVHLQVHKIRSGDGWSRCSCQEIAAVVARRDEIKICEEY